MNIGLGIGIPFTKNRILGAFTGSSLSLDFTSGNRTLDPRITFSRASNATVTGPDGVLRYAPHNLLTFSEQFDNAVWGKTSCNITANAVTAPNGSVTADRLVPNVGLNSPSITSNFTASAGVSYVLSVHVKPDSTNKFLMLQFDGDLWNSVSSAERPRVWFDPTTGAITATQRVTGSGVEVAADGSYRIYLSAFCSTSGATAARIAMQGSSGSVGGYTGDGTSGIYLWGAQLNVGSLQPYYPTTVKNLLGFTQEFDNAAWTKNNSFVQTNLLTWSEQFDNAAWGRTGITVTANAAVAPDGTTTADLLAATLADCTIGRYSVATSAGTLHTASVWMRADTPTTLSIFLIDSGGGSGNINAVCNVTTTWQRFTVQRTTSAGTTTIGFQVGGGNTFSSGESVYIWGAQLVQGSTPGDYQRTEGTVRAVMYPAPDGSRTADKLVENTAASIGHFVEPFGIPAHVVGETRTISVYAKAAERTFLQLIFTGIGPSSTHYIAGFNLENGTAGTPSGGQTSSIISVGDGWYSCSLTVTAQTTAIATHQIRLALNSSNAPSSYTGDGTSGIYIWGAQLSDSASLDPYVYNPGAAPAAAAYYGPRFDYDPVTLAPKGLLIEEQRTNSIRNNTMQGAVAGTPGALPTNWTYTGGGLAANVIGTGVEDGISYIDIQFVGTATSGSSGLRFEGTSGVSASTGQTWNSSVFIRRVAGSTSGLAGGVPLGLNLTYLVSGAGSDSASTSIGFGSLEVAAISQNRVLVTATGASAGITTIRPQVLFGHPVGNAIDITLRIGMPQLEQGAFATSVIPTSGAAATRAADVAVMQGANFSNWYRQDEGTLFAEAAFLAGVAAQSFTAQIAGDSSNYIAMYRDSSNQRLTGRIRSGAVDQAFMYATASSVIGGAQYKQALAYKVDDFATAANGASALTDTSGTVPTSMTTLGIGGAIYTSSVQLNGHIRKIAYFPRRLSNAELQGITS